MPRKSTIVRKMFDAVNTGLDAVGDGLEGWEGPDPVFVEDLAVFKPSKRKKKEPPELKISL